MTNFKKKKHCENCVAKFFPTIDSLLSQNNMACYFLETFFRRIYFANNKSKAKLCSLWRQENFLDTL